MVWFWTDDLAALLIDNGVDLSPSSRATVQIWNQRPVAVSAPPDSEPIVVARALLGMDSLVEEAGAA